MDYEKKYKEALERAKGIINYYKECNRSDETAIEDLEQIFPELKESEDERVRKWLIKYFNKADFNGMLEYVNGIKSEDIIAWLEKQDEIDKTSYEIAEKEKQEFVGDGFIKCYADFQDFKEGETYWLEYIGNDNYNVRSDNLLGKTYHITPCQLYTIFKKQTWLEKQGEQKHINDTDEKIVKVAKDTSILDMVEPNFHEGDWIVCQKEVCQITHREEGYNLLTTIYGIKKLPQNERILSTAHLWTIDDAKDGDVLVSKDNRPFIYNGKYDTFFVGAYCGINCVGDSFVLAQEKCRWTAREGVKPASKKQRIHLFQKIKEAGYEWNAEKKELKLLISNGGDFESNNSKQKPTWSDEDEENLQHCCGAVFAADYYTYEDKQDMGKWLLQLKTRLS